MLPLLSERSSEAVGYATEGNLSLMNWSKFLFCGKWREFMSSWYSVIGKPILSKLYGTYLCVCSISFCYIVFVCEEVTCKRKLTVFIRIPIPFTSLEFIVFVFFFIKAPTYV